MLKSFFVFILHMLIYAEFIVVTKTNANYVCLNSTFVVKIVFPKASTLLI